MKSLLRQPLFWIVLQGFVFGGVLGWTGRLEPERAADTGSYERFPFGSLSSALSHARTFGYPAFLQISGALAPEYRAVPVCHWIAHVLAVGGFYWGLRHVLRCPWTSLAAASSLFCSNVILRYLSALTADSLASSGSILTIGFLLRGVAAESPSQPLNAESPTESSVETAGWARWLPLGLATFATYQIRPAYLFLVPLLPVLGWLLLRLLRFRKPLPTREPHVSSRPVSSRPVSSRRTVVALSAWCLLPLLAFCSLRWLVVGQFSLVSFSGNNLAGVVGVFLTAEMVPELPADLRPLAKAALERRRQVAESDPSFSAAFTLDYMEIEKRFDASTWRVFVESARGIYGDDQKQINSQLRRLATAIVRARPKYYLIWLGKAAWRGVYMIVSEIVANPMYLLLLGLLAAVHGRYVVLRLRALAGAQRGARRGMAQPGSSAESEREELIEASTLLLVAISFAATKLLLVIITSPPLGRFMDPAGVFLPTVIVAAIARRLAWVPRS